jgi:hypothetical protein
MKRFSRRTGSAVVIALVLSIAGPASAHASGSGGAASGSGPAPYSLLAAAWWQWALQAPKSVNPVLDATGANCWIDQPASGPWFLAGSFVQTAITRTECRVPPGRALFIPGANQFYGAFLNDAAWTRSVDYARKQVACEAGANATVTVDEQVRPTVHERSIPFTVQLPTDNVFDLTPDVARNLMLAPTVDQGEYVLVPPLSRGAHKIRITSDFSTSSCGGSPPFTNDVTYQLTVG